MSMQNIQFTIEFYDQAGNPVPQYNKTDILSIPDFATLESVASQAYAIQVRFVNGQQTTQPPTVSLTAETQYVDDAMALINNTPVSTEGTTESGTLNGQPINQDVSFYIIFPDGTEIQDVILSPADYMKLQQTVNVFSIENATFTVQPPNTTYDQLYTKIQAKSPTSIQQSTPPATATSNVPLLTLFTILGANGPNWDCTLVFSQNPANGSKAGSTANYTLSTANVNYWIKNTATVQDETGIFVPGTVTPGQLPPTSQPSNIPTGTTQTNSIQQSITSATQQSAQAQDQVTALQSQLSQSQTQQQQLQQEIASLTTQVNSLTANNQTDTAQFAQLQSQLLEATNALQSLKGQDQNTQAQLAQATAALQEAESTIGLLTSQLNKLQQNTGTVTTMTKALGIASVVSLGLGILAIDPKKKTVGDILSAEIKKAGHGIKKAAGTAKKRTEKMAGRVYCKQCHRSHKDGHPHEKFNESQTRKLVNEAKKMGKNPDDYVADKFLEKRIKS